MRIYESTVIASAPMLHLVVETERNRLCYRSKNVCLRRPDSGEHLLPACARAKGRLSVSDNNFSTGAEGSREYCAVPVNNRSSNEMDRLNYFLKKWAAQIVRIVEEYVIASTENVGQKFCAQQSIRVYSSHLFHLTIRTSSFHQIAGSKCAWKRRRRVVNGSFGGEWCFWKARTIQITMVFIRGICGWFR